MCRFTQTVIVAPPIILCSDMFQTVQSFNTVTLFMPDYLVEVSLELHLQPFSTTLKII